MLLLPYQVKFVFVLAPNQLSQKSLVKYEKYCSRSAYFDVISLTWRPVKKVAKYQKLGKYLSQCTWHRVITSAYVITDVYIPTFYTSGRRNFINMLDHDEHSIIPENNIRYKYDTKETKTKIRGTQLIYQKVLQALQAHSRQPRVHIHPSLQQR